MELFTPCRLTIEEGSTVCVVDGTIVGRTLMEPFRYDVLVDHATLFRDMPRERIQVIGEPLVPASHVWDFRR